MMCSDQESGMDQNPPILIKPKAISLAFFPQNETFGQLPLNDHNSSLDGQFSKVKDVFCSSKEGLSNGVLKSTICDRTKYTNFREPAQH